MIKGSLPGQLSQDIFLALSAAGLAGEAIMKIYKGEFSSSLKKDKQPVTEADFESDKIIHQVLAESNHPIVSEETYNSEVKIGKGKTWIVDPLDGTTDFINKTGEFSIMIALVENLRSTIGVVYQPAQDLFYAAEDGKGTFRKKGNGAWEEISVGSNVALNKAKVIMSNFHLSEEEKFFISSLGINSYRKKGSAGLKICDIAAGEADLYFTTTDKMKQWDTAAGDCLIREAGGKITDMSGQDIIYNLSGLKNGLLVSNGKIHDEIIKKYKDFFDNLSFNKNKNHS